MRRTLLVVLGVVAILGILVPPALAQAPVPKVTITGSFDQITSAGRNIYDGDFARSGESEWYARTRFRPDFEFAVGRVKAVLGIEIDLQYGACGLTGTDGGGGTAGAAGCKGGNGGLDINTDVTSMLEVKWIYTEFDLTGKDSLMPFIPFLTVARVGGQPFGTVGNYKVSYANGDYAGFSGVTTWAPWIKSNLAYVMIEDEVAINKTRPINSSRGEDWSVIASVDLTVLKGLDIKPVYSYLRTDGTTSGSTRRTVNDASLGGGATNAAGSFQGNASHENRHTIGLDARWRFGPFSLDPTFFYQFGNNEYLRSAAGGGGSSKEDISAYLFDVIFGFQIGPLLLEARGTYTGGNKASDQLGSTKKKYYEPLDLDTGWYASNWVAITGLGIDYYNGGGGTTSGSMSTNVGYDRYGRAQFGARATYSLTPALSFIGTVTPIWTAEKVDTDTTQAAGSRGAPALTGASGDSKYFGTEAMAMMIWRFAPNTSFSLQGAYLFAGSALDGCVPAAGSGTTCGTNANSVKKDAEDGWTAAARITMAF